MYDFCQNEEEVIESDDGTPSYESEEDQEQVGSRDCVIIIRRRRL